MPHPSRGPLTQLHHQGERRFRRQVEIDPAALPPEPDPTRLPKAVTRKQAATIIARYFFPISARTLETWPLRYRVVPGHPAVIDTVELLAEARARLDSAPTLMGGRCRRRA